MCYESISHGAQGKFSLMFNFRCSIFDFRCSIFDVQVLAIIAGPQGTSYFSGANVLHHYHGVQITVSIVLEQDVTLSLSSLCGSVVNNFFSGPRGQWSTP